MATEHLTRAHERDRETGADRTDRARDPGRGAKLAGVPEALRQLQNDQTVMIRMLQAREAELGLMRAPEQHYADLRARLAEFERRLEKLEALQ